jgi:hypothetical protein
MDNRHLQDEGSRGHCRHETVKGCLWREWEDWQRRRRKSIDARWGEDGDFLDVDSRDGRLRSGRCCAVGGWGGGWMYLVQWRANWWSLRTKYSHGYVALPFFGACSRLATRRLAQQTLPSMDVDVDVPTRVGGTGGKLEEKGSGFVLS